MRIAIQGEPGSFSHEAALAMEPTATIVSCAVSADVFRLVENQEVAAAVIPIENSLAGSVTEHFDLLFESDVQIERESLLRIRHNLIGVPGATLEGMRQVLSHPVALAQCRRFFLRHPHLRPTAFYDTAGSVKHIVDRGDAETGAIASERAAHTYGGVLLAAGIEDNAANYTRFFLIRSRNRVQVAPNADKVSIAFTVANRPGTLVSALKVFAEHNTNLCKVESRPVHGQPWQYVFYVDYQVADAAAANSALAQLRQRCVLVKGLGQYPAAPPIS